MAQYTIQVRSIVEGGVEIFDFTYPIFDETYKPTLENNIIQWYYNREIGLETIGLFKQFLKAKMNVIMPKYNQLYNAQVTYLTKNLFYNKNLTDTTTRTTTSTATGNASGTTSDTEKMSDTPQGLNDGNDYLTEMTTNSGSNTSTSSTDVTNTESTTITSVGDDGMRYPASVWKEIQDSCINIDLMVIQDLSDLFMNIY